MRRRNYLATLTAALAGCSTSESGTPNYDSSAKTTTDGSSGATDAGSTDGGRSATETETATETATGSATVVSQKFVSKETDIGTTKAMTGEVKNEGDGRLSYVEVTATFENADGDVLETSMTNVLDLGPGETWEVWVEYPGDGSSAASGSIEVSDASQWTSSKKPESVELGSHELVRPDGQFSSPYVTGEAENTGEEALDYLEARVKFYAKNGNVLYSTFTNVTGLGAGQTWQFKLEFLSTNSDWESRLGEYAVALAV